MKSSIKQILFNELKKRRTSIYKFSKETGIPKSRIYQWERGNGSPKENDIVVIRSWLGQDVTPIDNTVAHEDGLVYGMVTIPAEDYIKELKKHNNTLENAILVSLTAIQGTQKMQGEGLAHFASEVINKLNQIQSALGSDQVGRQPTSSKHKTKQGHK